MSAAVVAVIVVVLIILLVAMYLVFGSKTSASSASGATTPSDTTSKPAQPSGPTNQFGAIGAAPASSIPSAPTGNPLNAKCCWNRIIQACNQNSDCDQTGEVGQVPMGCITSGTDTGKSNFGVVTCNTCAAQGKTMNANRSGCV